MPVPTILTIVQARVGSSRLPGKVLLPLAGRLLLVRMVERVRRAHRAGTVVVATTTEAADDAVAACCTAHGLACFRGDALDLLDRVIVIAIEIPRDADQTRCRPIDRISDILAQLLKHQPLEILTVVHQPVEVEQALINHVFIRGPLVFQDHRTAVFIQPQRVDPPTMGGGELGCEKSNPQ